MQSTWVTVRKCSIWVKIGDFLSCVTLKFDRWPWKTIGHPFYAASSFVHHFIAIGEFKLSYSPETLNLGQNWRFIVPCDLEIWRMTLKNYRAPLLCCFKLYASFHSHWWIQTKVTVRKHPIWVKINDLFSRVTLKFDGWPSKTILYTTMSFVHHFKAIGEFKLELQSGNAQFRSKSTIFLVTWPWNLSDDLEQGKSEGFDSCDWHSNLAQIGFKSSIFQPVWPWNLMADLEKL